jgi:hypothetical protein
MKEREYVRHPTDIPIEVDYDLSGIVADKVDYLSNVSFGGLSFQSLKNLETGAVINISIPLVKPVFHIRGRVVWCKRANEHFDVGVEFIEPERIFKARMVEQVCHIEHYKKEVLEEEGRHLTGEEAALEWIKKFAADFPSA